jgi:hypothetical protein
MMKVSNNGVETCYVQCKDCNAKLIMSGQSMLDCARTWNVRAARRAAMARHDMMDVSLLHSELSMDGETKTNVSLPNTEKMWELALAAELASDMDATPLRPDGERFEIRFDVIFPYLDALVQESAEKVPELDKEQEPGSLF